MDMMNVLYERDYECKKKDKINKKSSSYVGRRPPTFPRIGHPLEITNSLVLAPEKPS
jgi:hypothetical protein